MTHRIPFLRLSRLVILATFLAATLASAADFGYLVYVGTYTDKDSKGIYAFRFDPASGESESIGLAAETENPSFLAVDPNQQVLYTR